MTVLLTIWALLQTLLLAGEMTAAGAKLAMDYVTGRAVPVTAARSTYWALCTAAAAGGRTPTLAQVAAVEPFTAGTNGYSRPSPAWTDPGAADPTVSSNNGTLTVGPFTADPANITHAYLVTAATGTTGDVLFGGTLTVAKDAASGESIQFAAAAAVLELSGTFF